MNDFQTISYHLIDLNISWDEVEIESCYIVSEESGPKGINWVHVVILETLM